MGKLAEAYVDIGANLKPLDAGLGRARSMLAGLASKISFGNVAAGGVAIVASTAAVGAGLLDAAKKASALGESLSKVQTVFGPASKEVIGQADEMARRFGVVRRETLDAAAGFGLMAQAAGMSREASAGVGTELVKLGVDLASFHNLTNQDAFEKLRSGLAGEAEPLRPLGILLSEDAVKAEALAIGLTKVKRELTDQEKVIARLSLIRRQAGPAIGDKERTKDSAENQMKRLAGDVENAATAFGEKLLPALTSSIDLVRELGSVAGDMGAAFKDAFGVGPAEAFGQALKLAIDTARVGVDTARDMAENPGRTLRDAARAAAPAAGPLGTLAAALIPPDEDEKPPDVAGPEAMARHLNVMANAHRQTILDQDAERNKRDQARGDAKTKARLDEQAANTPEAKAAAAAKAARDEQFNQYLSEPAAPGVAGRYQTFEEYQAAPARAAEQEKLKDEKAKLDQHRKELAEEKTIRGPASVPTAKPKSKIAPPIAPGPIDESTLSPEVLAARKADEARRTAAAERQAATLAGARPSTPSAEQRAAMARAGIEPAEATDRKPGPKPKAKPEPAKIAAAAKPRTEGERLADVAENERKRKEVDRQIEAGRPKPKFDTREEGIAAAAKLNDQRRELEGEIADLKKPKHFESQEFSSGSDFASFAIQKSLSDPDSEAKKTTEELRTANDKLEEVKAELARVTAAIQNQRPGGTVLRGRS